MNLPDVLAGRRSIRTFKQDPISDSIIKDILHAGILAPAPSNRQQWEVVIVNDKNVIERLHKEAGAQETILNCPVLFVVIVDMEFNKENYSNVQATAAAVQNMQLKAFDLGYGSCCMAGIGDVDKIKEILNIQDPWLPVCYMMLGVPAESPSVPPKKELGEIYYYNKYVQKSERMQSSVFPKDWTLNQLRMHQKFVSRAYKLGTDYEFYDVDEVNNIKNVLKDYLSYRRKVLALLSYDGTIIRQLEKLFDGHELICCELSREAADFVQFKTKKPSFTVFNDKIENVEDNSIDIVLITFSLEKVPNPEIFLKEAKRVVSKDGKIIIFFKNKASMYGLMYAGITKGLGVKHMEGFYVRSGPFAPLSVSEMKDNIKNLNLKIVSRGGFFFVPAEVKIYQQRLDGYMKRHGKKLSIAKYFVKPAVGFGNFLFNATKGYNKHALAVTRYWVLQK